MVPRTVNLLPFGPNTGRLVNSNRSQKPKQANTSRNQNRPTGQPSPKSKITERCHPNPKPKTETGQHNPKPKPTDSPTYPETRNQYPNLT